MFRKLSKIAFILMVIIVIFSGKQVKTANALELQSYPSKKTVEHISKLFSLIDDDGMEFLFHKQKVDISDVSEVQVGRSYRFLRLENDHLSDVGIVKYPLYLNGNVFAVYTEYYDGETRGSTAISSIIDEYYYDDDLDYADIAVVADGKDSYVVSGIFVWHYENGTLVSKIRRDGITDARERQIVSLVEEESGQYSYAGKSSPVSLNNVTSKNVRSRVIKTIDVSVVPQYQSPTCWAAAICAVGNYMTGPSNWTPDSLSIQVKGEITGGFTEDYIKGLLLFTYPGSNQQISSTSLEYSPSDEEIVNWIDHNTPFILRLRGGSEGHAITACGYVFETGVSAVYAQDSASGKREILHKDDEGRFGYTFCDNETYFYWERTIVLTGWQKPGNGDKWVYFDRHGNYATGWFGFEDETYYFSESGEMQTGWVKINGLWFYFSISGKMQTGWVSVDGYWYYLDDSGRLLHSQWLSYKGDYYYLDSSGKMRTGWLVYNGTYYYLGSDGVMRTGWVKDGGNWYYMNSDGSIRVGWLVKDGSYYYLDSNGRMITGWYRISGDWYFFNSDGSMATGWLERGGSWYYLSSSGIMQTGWLNSSGHTFYLNQDGSMRTGWLSYGGSSYYLRYDNNQPVSGGPTGSMIYSRKARIGGVTYEFNARGEAYKTLPGNIVPKAYKPIVEAA